MYTMTEAVKILGITRAAVYRKIRKLGIVPVKNGKFMQITDEELGLLKNARKQKKVLNKKPSTVKNFWRVSVWNDDLCCYVVAKCGLSKSEAEEFASGKDAICRPC